MPVTAVATPTCELRGVGHRFGDGPWLFRGLTTTLVAGEVYALTGPSGSGKSTLLAILASWLEPAEGTIELPTGARIGWVFQNPHGSPRRAAIDQLELPLLAAGASLRAARAGAIELLDRFALGHLRDGRPFRALSGGEAQRLMLAIGLAAAPTVLLVDEPTAQLDRATAATVNDAITRVADDDTIIVVATHDDDTRRACTAGIRLDEAGPA